MNRILLSIALMLSTLVLSAQNEVDALRYSQFSQTGSARYTAMGGAFGALGGDLSVMASNPAGIGVYRKSDFGFSLSWAWNNVGTDFNGSKITNYSKSFKPSNIGFVVAQPNIESSGWKFINYGFSYNLLADYNNQFTIQGINTTSSILDWAVEQVNLYPDLKENSPYVLSETVFFNDSIYTNHYANSGKNYDLDQKHLFTSTGYAGEYNFSVAGNYQDKLYIGASVGIQHISYSQQINHSEEPYPYNSLPLKWIEAQDYLKTTGKGYNLKVGFIYKLNQIVRIGGAIHTPTWYSFRDDYWTDVYATIEKPDRLYDNFGKSAKMYYYWKYTSPFRAMANAALVFGKHGIVSAEYEYVGYQGMKLSADDNSFNEENQTINSLYTAGHNLKVGGEYRIGFISVRGGFDYYGSAYKSNSDNSEAYKLVYSGGAGIATGSIYFDLAYQYITSKKSYNMYKWEGSMANLSNNNNRFTTTIGFRF